MPSPTTTLHCKRKLVWVVIESPMCSLLLGVPALSPTAMRLFKPCMQYYWKVNRLLEGTSKTEFHIYKKTALARLQKAALEDPEVGAPAG